MQTPYKWRQVGPEAIRLAARGLSPLEIAEALGVDRSTVQRWMAAGKITDTRTSRTVEPASPLADAAELPALAWAAAIRAAHTLDDTDEKLVALADLALSVAENPAEQSSIRLAAAGRFQSLTKQLSTRIRQMTEERPPAPVQAATVRADPRAILNSTIQ
jgi:excisionase family DNA binding protein